MKIRPVGAELLHVDRRTDMTKLIVAFRNFVKQPKNHHVYQKYYKNWLSFDTGSLSNK